MVSFTGQLAICAQLSAQVPLTSGPIVSVKRFCSEQLHLATPDSELVTPSAGCGDFVETGAVLRCHCLEQWGQRLSPPARYPAIGQSEDSYESCTASRPQVEHCRDMSLVVVSGNAPITVWLQVRVLPAHHALHRSCVSHTGYETTRHGKDLAPGFLGFRVSGGGLTREILVSALPVSGARKPFPGAERGDRFDSVGDRFAKAMTDHGNAAILRWGERD
jgi:hypothetical protein